MKLTKVNIKKIKSNEENPRVIKNNKFKQLVKSIKEFPEMLNIRPIVVNNDMIVLGGNMRLKACQEAGLKEIPVLKVKDLNEEQQREFIIKDNVGFGDWDWDILANEWKPEQLDDWGLDVWQPEDILEDDFDMGGSENSSENLKYIKWGTNSISITEKEIELLDKKLKDYILKNSISTGFIFKLLS